jgi:regulatory protein
MDDGRRTAERIAPLRDAVLRWLARRDRTESELRDRLRGRGHDDGEIEHALSELRSGGYVDDHRAAVVGIVEGLRAGHAASRIERKLHARGVDERTLRRAWETVGADHETDDAPRLRRQLERRLRGERLPLDGPALRRVYNAMLRAGFDADEVAAALEPHHSRGSADGHFD